MQSFDVLVIGNGILGLSTAYALHLEDSSLKIGIVGPENRLGNASAAAGAMLGCFGEVTQSTFDSEFGLAKLEMAVRSAKMWPEWLDQINSGLSNNEALVINPGTFIILNSKSGKLDNKNYSAIISALAMYGETHEEIDPTDIPGTNPVEDCRPLRALHLPHEGAINPTKLLNALDTLINENKNLHFIDGHATQIQTTSGKINCIQIDNGESIKADRYLVAAGGYSQNLIKQIPELEFKIPKILFGPGCSLLLNHPGHNFKHVIRSPNRAGACGSHILPHNNSTIYIGASNNLRASAKNQPKSRDVYYLLQRSMEQFNQDLYKSEIIKWQVGNRPVTVDTYPLIGETSIPGLWILTGTYRDGLHDSPLLARSIAKQMLGLPPLYTNLFLPERFPIQTMTKQQAIDEAVNHHMSAAYEHGIKMPKLGWDSVFAEMWQTRVEILYKELEIDIALPPDLLIMLDQEPDCIPYFRKYYQTLMATGLKAKIPTLTTVLDSTQA